MAARRIVQAQVAVVGGGISGPGHGVLAGHRARPGRRRAGGHRPPRGQGLDPVRRRFPRRHRPGRVPQPWPRPGRARLAAGPDRRRRGPRPGGAFIWSRGRLRRIPQGGAFGIPDRVLPLVRTRLLSPAGVRPGRARLRAPHAPRSPLTPPWRRSCGRAWATRSSNASSSRCSAACTRARSTGSAPAAPCPTWSPWPGPAGPSCSRCAVAVRRRRSPPAPPAPPLVSLRGGLTRLVDAVVAAGRCRPGAHRRAVTALRRVDAGWHLTTPDLQVVAQQVVLATPAHASAELLAALDPGSPTSCAASSTSTSPP